MRSCQALALFLGALLSLSATAQPTPPSVIKGVYGHPKPLWEEGFTLPELNVNAVFVRSGAIDSATMARCRAEGVLVYAEFALLNGKDYVEEHPEAWAINARGERVEPATWFMGVCPTEPGFRAYRFGLLRKLLEEHRIDGLWLDYVHWHAQFEEPQPILPETCFCDQCLQRFSTEAGVRLPDGNTAAKARRILEEHSEAWRDWRCGIIREWAVEIRDMLKSSRPEALLGLYHAPWTDAEFGGARRRILGLDYDMLREVIDVFSPMVYHTRMGRPPAWVASHVEWLCDRLGPASGGYPRVWPIVQANDGPEPVSPEAFRRVLLGGLSSCSQGVMMFTSRGMVDAGKRAVMREVYGGE